MGALLPAHPSLCAQSKAPQCRKSHRKWDCFYDSGNHYTEAHTLDPANRVPLRAIGFDIKTVTAREFEQIAAEWVQADVQISDLSDYRKHHGVHAKLMAEWCRQYLEAVQTSKRILHDRAVRVHGLVPHPLLWIELLSAPLEWAQERALADVSLVGEDELSRVEALKETRKARESEICD